MPGKIGSINPLRVPRFCSAQAVITRDLVKRRKRAIWQKIFLPAQVLVTLTTPISAARAASLLPVPVTAIPTPRALPAAHTPCTKPETPGRKTLVPANASKPTSSKSWLQRPHLFHSFTWSPCLKCLSPTDQKPLATSDLFSFVFFFKPLTFIFNGCVLDFFLLGIGKYRPEKRSKRKHFPWWRLLDSNVDLFFDTDFS